MIKQMELIPVIKHIPQWLADYFYKANAGEYKGKEYFYNQIKPFVLGCYGEFIGYELQIIKYKCTACGGTGTYKHYHWEDGQRYLLRQEPCFCCINGIYATMKFSLRKYVLNGKSYHIPQTFKPDERHINTIRGKIKHEKIDSKEAYSAYLIILWKYDKQSFYRQLKEITKTKLKWVPELIQKIIRKDNTKDELPF